MESHIHGFSHACGMGTASASHVTVGKTRIPEVKDLLVKGGTRSDPEPVPFAFCHSAFMVAQLSKKLL